MGLFKKRKESHCITPGLTEGIAVGELPSDFPKKLPHHKIHKTKYTCGNHLKPCIQIISDSQVYPIRARTVTSAGMNAIEIKDERRSKKQEEETIKFLTDYHLDAKLLQSAYSYYTNNTNVVNIAKDNLR